MPPGRRREKELSMRAQIKRLGADDGAQAEEAVRSFKKASRSVGSLEAFLRNPANYLLVADVGGEAVGFLMAYRLERADRDAGQMFVYEVDVAAAWRRRGLARALLGEIVVLARAEGMFEAFVLTSRSNVAARRLYTRTGARVEDDSALLFVYPLALDGDAA
jgi:aminoglycoside 3-N-acetyltransferase I